MTCDACGEPHEDIKHVESKLHNANLCLPCRRHWGEEKRKDNDMTTTEPNWCVYPECQNTARTRGLCHGHYQVMRDRVRKGAADEKDLERRGLLLPKGTGGSPTNVVKDKNGVSAFEKGSKIRGRTEFKFGGGRAWRGLVS